MSKTVQIGSNVYTIPNAGENPGWGEDLTAFLCAVTDALADVQGPNDILITSATLANNQSSAANISGLLFNVAEVESVEIDYFVERVFDSGASTTVETGKILGSYDGTEFVISIETTNDTGVSITVLNTGQLQYTSTNLANHTSSVIRFRAKSIDTP